MNDPVGIDSHLKLFAIQALRSTQNLSDCLYVKVGAILYRNGKLVSIGSNDMHGKYCLRCPKAQEFLDSKQEDPWSIQYESKCHSPHAEEVVLRHSLPGDALFISHSPCIDCAKLIVQKQVAKVYYVQEYRHTEGLDYLRQHNIQFEQLNKKEDNEQFIPTKFVQTTRPAKA